MMRAMESNQNSGASGVSTSAVPEGGASEGNLGRSRKNPLTEVLPSDRLSLDRQIDAIKAFAVAFDTKGAAVSNAEAGAFKEMAAGTIIVTNAFFSDLGILTRAETGFLVSQAAIDFVTAEAGLSPEKAPSKLRPLFEKHWSMQVLGPRFRLQSQMESETVFKVLGEACGAIKEHLPRLEILLGFLCFVGCLKREGSIITRGLVTGNDARSAAPDPARIQENKDRDDTPTGMEQHTLTLNAATGKKFVIQSPAEITKDDLERIKNWLSFQLIVTTPNDP